MKSLLAFLLLTSALCLFACHQPTFDERLAWLETRRDEAIRAGAHYANLGPEWDYEMAQASRAAMDYEWEIWTMKEGRNLKPETGNLKESRDLKPSGGCRMKERQKPEPVRRLPDDGAAADIPSGLRSQVSSLCL